MNREEILQDIERTQQHLATLEKMLETVDYGDWQPPYGSKYYYVTSKLGCDLNVNNNTPKDRELFNAQNAFRTFEQAQAECERIRVRRHLETIARKLNKKAQNEFSAYRDYKYYLYMRDDNGKIDLGSNLGVTTQGVVYCLSEDFYKVAIEEIGQERLKNYLLSYVTY